MVHPEAQKKELRALMRTLLKGLGRERFQEAEILLLEEIKKWQGWNEIQNILAYFSISGEINLENLIKLAVREGKKIFFPVIRSKDKMEFLSWNPGGKLVENRYGISEPQKGINWAASAGRSLVLVPALAYSKDYYRLGRGGGYYDKFFHSIQGKEVKFFGICFREQILETIPKSKWDIKVDEIYEF